MSDDALRNALATAMASFAAVVAAIEPDDWQAPSPCEDWTVFDIVDHVVAGDRFAARVIAGASMAQAIDGLTGLTPQRTDPVGEVIDAARVALAAFGAPLDQLVDHPIGQISMRRFLGFRIIDQLGHTWDVSTALGKPVRLDEQALAIANTIARDEIDVLAASAHFATTADDGNDVTDDSQAALLRMLGRARQT